MIYHFNWGIVFGYWPLFVKGVAYGLGIAVVSLALGSLLGTVAAVLAEGRFTAARVVVRVYTEVLRNVPILLWAYLVYYGLPHAGIRLPSPPVAFVVALALYAGAYLTDVVRAGLRAVPRGYADAGRSLGLSATKRFRLVTLPLTLRTVLPAVGNNFISLFKDTSIAAALSVPEITFATQYVNITTFRVIEAWACAAALYLCISYLLALGLRSVEHRFRMVR